MFAARGIAVSLSVFVMVYCVLSLAVCRAWRAVWLHAQRHPVRRVADVLFALRMLPLVAAAVITAAFTVPSFLLLEPRAIDEPMGGIPLALGICGAMLGIFGVANASIALRRASRTIATWTSAAQPVESCSPIPVLRISRVVPAKFALGCLPGDDGRRHHSSQSPAVRRRRVHADRQRIADSLESRVRARPPPRQSEKTSAALRHLSRNDRPGSRLARSHRDGSRRRCSLKRRRGARSGRGADQTLAPGTGRTRFGRTSCRFNRSPGAQPRRPS